MFLDLKKLLSDTNEILLGINSMHMASVHERLKIGLDHNKKILVNFNKRVLSQ